MTDRHEIPALTDNPYTLRISEYVRGHDMVELVTGPDEDVVNKFMVAHYGGKISWAQDWAGLTDLSLTDLGIVGRVFHPGHGDPCAQYEEYFLL